MIEYTITNAGNDTSDVFRLITTILDPAGATGLELAGVYQQRWEHLQ